MKKILTLFAIIILSICLSILWLSFPTHLPPPPESIAIFIVDLFNAETQEQVANVEVIYVFSISTIVSTLVILISQKIKKMLRS